MEKEKKQIVEYGKRMSEAGLTNGTTGNLSIYDSATGYMAISPSGMSYLETGVEDIAVMKLNGEIVEGNRKPSSEFALHAIVYQTHPEAKAIVHTHSTYCTTFACMNQPIQAVHFLIANAQTDIIPCCPYATYGTKELAENVKNTKTDGLAMLLANHGMVAFGPTMEKAFAVAKDVEWLAEIQWRAMCIGKPVILSKEQINDAMESFKTYGQTIKK